MEHYRSLGIVLGDTLEWDFSDRPAITLQGKIFLAGNLCLNVTKSLREYKDRANRSRIETVKYSYNLNIEGVDRSEIFRYDNFDDTPRAGHSSCHHHHRFDPPGHEVEGSPFEFEDPERRPNLGQVIEEAHQYYLERLAPSEKEQPD
ncbi:MAG TPA: DUF6516 family protein [Candidatus Obscuribacterales bacterium]